MSFIQYVEYHESISSTNDRAKELLKLRKLPLLVVANTQTAGRGRENKAWWSAPGAMLLSIGIDLNDYDLNRDYLSVLSLAVGLAVLDVVSANLPEGDKEKVKIHWPNDVYFDGQKIAGILIESSEPHLAVVGIGVNVNNRIDQLLPDFKGLPILSLVNILGHEVNLTVFTLDVLAKFFDYAGRVKTEKSTIISKIAERCSQIGHFSQFQRDGILISGKCHGIAEDGSLILDTPTGRIYMR